MSKAVGHVSIVGLDRWYAVGTWLELKTHMLHFERARVYLFER
jgi:hypothetical protein